MHRPPTAPHLCLIHILSLPHRAHLQTRARYSSGGARRAPIIAIDMHPFIPIFQSLSLSLSHNDTTTISYSSTRASSTMPQNWPMLRGCVRSGLCRVISIFRTSAGMDNVVRHGSNASGSTLVYSSWPQVFRCWKIPGKQALAPRTKKELERGHERTSACRGRAFHQIRFGQIHLVEAESRMSAGTRCCRMASRQRRRKKASSPTNMYAGDVYPP